MKKVRKRLWLFIIKVIFLLGGNRGFKKSFVCPFLFFSNISAYEANLFTKRANHLNTLYLINMFSRTNYTILKKIESYNKITYNDLNTYQNLFLSLAE